MNSKDYDQEDLEDEGLKTIDFHTIQMGQLIGGGGVGVIYNGWYQGKQVALKTLFDPRIDEELKQEYRNEIFVMSKLKHKNIVQFLGACLDPPNLCFVMELCQCSLYDFLHKSRIEMSIQQCLGMMNQIASAMDYLHNKKPILIHRDLKSQNVLLDKKGDLKLCDFGLVGSKNTKAGTPCYTPPELIKNKPFCKKVDVYMFGILVWEMLAREIPFDGWTSIDIYKAVVAGERPPLSSLECPPICHDFIQRCWHQDPTQRPEFTEILHDLIIISQTLSQRTQVEIAGDMGGDTLDALLH